MALNEIEGAEPYAKLAQRSPFASPPCRYPYEIISSTFAHVSKLNLTCYTQCVTET